MSDPLVSPKAQRLATPTWLDRRLVLGVLLVLVSVVVGARLLSSADASQAVWVATRDLAPGSTLTEGDLAPGRAQLFGSGGRYLLASGPAPVGYVLQRGVGADELLPRESLVRPDAVGTGLRQVSVPVQPGHLPADLTPGQQVDVWVTPGAAAAGAGPGTTTTTGTATTAGVTAARRVLSGVPVTLRPGDGGLASASASSVVLSVRQEDVAALVQAAQAGGVDLVRVPRGDELPGLTAGVAQAG